MPTQKIFKFTVVDSNDEESHYYIVADSIEKAILYDSKMPIEKGMFFKSIEIIHGNVFIAD